MATAIDGEREIQGNCKADLRNVGTNACKPAKVKHDETGKMIEKSVVFKAGQKYEIEHTAEVETWLERGYCYIAGQPEPRDPPRYDQPIHATLTRTPDEIAQLDQIIERAVDRGIERLAGKPIFVRLLEKLGFSGGKASA